MLKRMLEEVFPFFAYCRNCSCVERRLALPDILVCKMYADYVALSPEQLAHRIKEEHVRASVLDEKTFKMTLSLSVGLTILGLAIGFFAKTEYSGIVRMALFVPIALSLPYLLVAGYLAIGALRTVPKYGYGTHFVLKSQEGGQNARILFLAQSLACQECMNNKRHLRNEASFQALRNGFALLGLWILIFFVATFGFDIGGGMNVGSGVVPTPATS